jgi:predicted amidohydrolase YtcJ
MLESKRTVFSGARFITMDERMPEAECICTIDGRIECLGSREEVMASLGSAPYEEVDLGGGVVYPGFIDTHSHISSFSNALNWAACGVDKGNIAGVLDTLRAWAVENPEDWIIGYGFDDTGLPDARHMNRHELDTVSTDRPILVAHISLHLGYCNTKALEVLGLDKGADIPGGIVEMGEDGTPTGVLYETAFFGAQAKLPQYSFEKIRENMIRAMNVYASKGITTFMDGGVGVNGGAREFMQVYMDLVRKGDMPIRGFLQMMPAEMDHLLEHKLFGFGSDMLFLGGAKLFIDGSIQGYTAALKEGYHARPDHNGVLLCDPDELADRVLLYQANGVPTAIHANGDQGAEIVISAFERAVAQHPEHKLAHMLIHAQTVSDEHLQRMKAIGVIPSFFVRHVEVWGDRHKKYFLGPERASRMDPCGSAVALGMPFGLHVDSPILPPTVLGSMHVAVNRITSGGEVLGPDQRISAREAVKAYTTYAALCCAGELDRGQLSPGRFADFVLLDRNIEESDPLTIRDIKVCATYCGGRKVYEG